MTDLTPDEALAALERAVWSAVYHSMRHEGVSEDHAMARADVVRIELGKALQGFAIVRSDELAGLRAVATEAERYHEAASGGHLPWDRHVALEDALRGLRSALEGVSR